MTPQPNDRAQLIEDDSLEFHVLEVRDGQAISIVDGVRVELPVILLERIEG